MQTDMSGDQVYKRKEMDMRPLYTRTATSGEMYSAVNSRFKLDARFPAGVAVHLSRYSSGNE